MLKPGLPLLLSAPFALLVSLGCRVDKPPVKPAGPAVEAVVPRDPSYCTEAEIHKIIVQFRGRPLPARLHSFLTDPRFLYDRTPDAFGHPRDNDLGLEREFGVMWLEPQAGTSGRHRGDRAFLERLNQDYAPQIRSLEPRYREVFGQAPFTLTAHTRLAKKDLAFLLAHSADDPKGMELLRKVIHHCLTR